MFRAGIADFDALSVGARVERAVDFQAGLGRCRADQFDGGEAIGQRPAAPVLGDVTEQPVLDLLDVPGGQWWIGSRARYRRRAFVVRALPEPRTRAVGGPLGLLPSSVDRRAGCDYGLQDSEHIPAQNVGDAKKKSARRLPMTLWTRY
jgi:hypothetical protein